jgi:hydroxyacylglutathione hydrolase
MKHWLLVAVMTASVPALASSDLAEKVWIHGSEDCALNRDPPIDIFEFNPDTFILRQNKCVQFEAPFIYVLFGTQTVLVVDTGATPDAESFPLYDTVQTLISGRAADTQSQSLQITVIHSHGHRDHKAADAQFQDQPGVTLVKPTDKAVRQYFGFSDWPSGLARIDLGGRALEVIPVPGHQGQDIALYDEGTGWLLTGDTVYPGRVYVKNWKEYRSSVARLEAFAETHTISGVLGSHIEMSRDGTLFPLGATYQPQEASLLLTANDLSTLNQALQKAGDKPQEIVTDKLIVTPVGIMRKMMGAVLKAFGG